LPFQKTAEFERPAVSCSAVIAVPIAARVCLFSDAAFESAPEKTLTGMILKPADMDVNKILFVRTLGIEK
jgi:hypothetical protein